MITQTVPLKGYPVNPQSTQEINDFTPKSSTRFVLDFAIKQKSWQLAIWMGYILPGQTHKLLSCGKFGLLICKNHTQHPESKDYAIGYRKKCFRSGCPLCVEAWANRMAGRVAKRVWTYVDHLFDTGYAYPNPFSFVVSFPESMYDYDVKKLKKVLRMAKKAVGITASVDILHPWRFDKKNNMAPYVSVHYHGIGFGGINGKAVDKLYQDYGIVVKKLRTLKTESGVFVTAKYNLSHAGVKARTHALTYTGDLSYNSKVIHVTDDESPPKCPHCPLELKPGRIPLKRLPFLTGIPPPFKIDEGILTDYPLEYCLDNDFHYYDDSDFWRVITGWDLHIEKYLRKASEFEEGSIDYRGYMEEVITTQKTRLDAMKRAAKDFAEDKKSGTTDNPNQELNV